MFVLENNKYLTFLGSDGGLFSYSLDGSNCKTHGELFSVIDFISLKFDVSMQPLEENYVALYGADCNQEGAALVVYSTQFRIPQIQQFFKLFTNGAKLWFIENSIFLPVGQNLAVLPFKLDVEQIAAFIGSHKSIQKEVDADIKIVNNLDVASWVESQKIRDRDVPELLRDAISAWVYQGLPEGVILSEILPDTLKNNETKVLSHCLKYFSDFPEKHLANIVKFLLEVDASHFNGNQCDVIGLPECLQPLERINLLDSILKRSFNEITLLPYLRSQLSLNNVLLLLEYIYLISSEAGYVLTGLSFVDTEYKLLAWCNILIDSCYQKVVLSNSESVIYVFQKFSNLIQNHLLCLKDLNKLTPLLTEIKRQKLNRENMYINLRYTVEQMTLYS